MIGGKTVITLSVVPSVDRTSHELRSSGWAYSNGADLRSVTAVGSSSLGLLSLTLVGAFSLMPKGDHSTESARPDIPLGSYWLRPFGGGRVSPMYKLDWEPKGLLRTYSGRISWAEVNESISEVHSAPRYEDLSYVINDFSECESVEISRDQIEDIAARVSGAQALQDSLCGYLAICAEHCSDIHQCHHRRYPCEYLWDSA